jgi:hypothetical protein
MRGVAVAFLALSAFLLPAAPLHAQQVQSPPAILVEDSASLGALQGELDARNESTTGWWWRGFAGGALLGPIGGGFAYALANNSGVTLPPHRAMILAAERSPSYAQNYEAAFADKLRDRRERATIVGGALGTAALAAVATTIWAVYYYY